MINEDNYLGCLISGAIGDSLGYSGSNEKELKITSNTQLSLFTANGLIYGLTRMTIKGIGSDIEKWVYLAYKDWYKLQEEKKALEPSLLNISWLLHIDKLSESRRPVENTVNILKNSNINNIDSIAKEGNQYDCVTRVVSVGLCYPEDESLERVFERAVNIAKLTHSNPEIYLCAGVFATLLASLRSNGLNIEESLRDIFIILKLYPQSDSLISSIEDTILLSQNSDSYESIRENDFLLGLYFAIKHNKNITFGIEEAVKSSNNPSVVGFITGSILGLINGEGKIPEELKSKLEIRDVIEELARDLYSVSHLDLERLVEDKTWWAKYVDKKLK